MFIFSHLTWPWPGLDTGLTRIQRTNKRDMHSSETERKYEEVKGSLDNMRYVPSLKSCGGGYA